MATRACGGECTVSAVARGATLRAFAVFRARYPKATLTLAGEGPMRGELEALAAELGEKSEQHSAI